MTSPSSSGLAAPPATDATDAGGAGGAVAEDWRDAGILLDRQTAVLELIASAAPLRSVLAEILASLQRLLQGARCSVLLLDRERGTLHHGAALDLPDAYVAAIDGLRIGEGQGSCGTAAALGVPVVASDVRVDPRWVAFRGAAADAGLRACWSTPIRGRDGRPVGTFAVYHSTPHVPTLREERLIDRFTHLAAVAIDHAGLLGDLVESERRFRRSFDANALGMAILGPDGVVETANDALRRMIGDAPLVGRSLADLVTPGGEPLDVRLARLEHEDVASFEGLLHSDGPDDVAVEVTVSVLRHRGRTPDQYVANVLDLTERRLADRERRARLEAETARRTAEELLHEKSALLAAVGHEARTPMQAIVGFAELLGTMDLDETRRREALGHIGAAAGHVMDLLTDVLDLSRLEAGALTLTYEPVVVRDVVAEVFGLLSAEAVQRGVELTHDLDAASVLADRRRLRQVLLNLVGNAVRHGRDGGHVRVRAHRAGPPGRLAVVIEDDGPGIPPDLLPRLFLPFAHGAGEENIGLGLGLARGLTVAMHGDLALECSSPGGTTMVLTLPDALPDAHPAA